MKAWTWGTGNVLHRGVFTGSLTEAALHTEEKRVVLIVGQSYSVPQLLLGNGIKKKKFSLKHLLP